MSRQLLKKDGDLGHYLVTDDVTGVYWAETKPLPKPRPVDPAERLEMERQQAQMEPVLPSLYCDGDAEARRATERRRAADRVLEDHGIRPRGW